MVSKRPRGIPRDGKDIMTNLGLGPAILFCPADRPDRYAKALDRADAVILDLEDAVAPPARNSARESLVLHQLDPERTIIRINAAGSEDFRLDLLALKQTDYRYVMLAKTESLESLARLTDYSVVALCETALGVVNAPVLATAENVVALMWGAEDLVASLDGTSSRHSNGLYRNVAGLARSQILLAAGAAGKAAWDSVYLDIGDLAGLFSEAEDARASGFTAKVSIHPRQMQVIREAFAPTTSEVEFASGLLAAAGQARSVFSFEGRMVDEPVLRQARRTISRAASHNAAGLQGE